MLGFFKRFFKPKATPTVWEPSLPDRASALSVFWGRLSLGPHESYCCHLGQRLLFIVRFQDEWHIAETSAPLITQDAQPSTLPFKTFILANQGHELEIMPHLPNRPLVSLLDNPVHIPAGEKASLYVNCPIWLKISLPHTGLVLLDTIPTQLLSDTWFGENTMEGELCYANHSQSSTQLSLLSGNNQHIIIPLLIKNRSRKTLIFDQVSVPLPYLSVYSDGVNRLWTEQLIIYRDGEEIPQVKIAKGPPRALAGNITLLSPPLIELKASTNLKHLFFSLLGRNGRHIGSASP